MNKIKLIKLLNKMVKNVLIVRLFKNLLKKNY